jgi:hypothetical protein
MNPRTGDDATGDRAQMANGKLRGDRVAAALKRFSSSPEVALRTSDDVVHIEQRGPFKDGFSYST